MEDNNTDTTGLLVEDVPEAVRAAVEADSIERDMTRNDVVIEIMARRFRVPYTPSGYPHRGSATTTWHLKMPRALHSAIRGSTEGTKLTARGVIIATLELHYDLPVTSPRRRPSHTPLDPEIVRDARARAEAGESIRSLSRRYGIKRETIAKAIRA